MTFADLMKHIAEVRADPSNPAKAISAHDLVLEFMMAFVLVLVVCAIFALIEIRKRR